MRFRIVVLVTLALTIAACTTSTVRLTGVVTGVSDACSKGLTLWAHAFAGREP